MPAPPERSTDGSPVITPARVVIALCLFLPFPGVLSVGLYSRLEPRFIGMPFFYWYQMLWVPLTALLSLIAFRLVQREKAKRHEPRKDDAR